MKSQILEDGGPGQEGAAHAGEQLPVTQVCSRVRSRCVAGLLHQLTVHLVAQRPQVQAGLQHTLDDRDRLPGRLQLLQAVEELHGLLTHRAVAFPAVVWERSVTIIVHIVWVTWKQTGCLQIRVGICAVVELCSRFARYRKTGTGSYVYASQVF